MSSSLNHLQLSHYAEYLVKMEFTKLGFSVFSNALFVDHYYSAELKSKPGYGLNLSERNLSHLPPFAFSERARTLA